MNRQIMMAGVLFASLGLAACQTTKEAKNLATLGVDFSWSETKACSDKPPAFTITNIPADTKTLKFHMTDMNVPSYNHGGGTVEYSGSGDIPEGSFRYTGPCPPSGSHNYRFQVTALNADGTLALGKGENTKAFPPK
jgi:phosphatidylethanolamine-binding protein (PEBP) family uncharacterized protein